MLVLITSVLLALSISFCCSLIESSVLSLRQADIARIRQKDPQKGEVWERLRGNIEQPIAAILILNTLAATVGATVAGTQFAALFGQRWVPLFSVGFAMVIIQWGEILPKTLGVRYSAFIAAHVGRGLLRAISLLLPAVWLTRLLNRPFESAPKEGVNTVDEIRALARYASFASLIDRRQENIITKSMQIQEMKVQRVMTPRTRVAALPETATIAELLQLVKRTSYSRIPVFRGQIDNVVGILLAKDLLIALHDGTLRADEFSVRRVGEFMTEPVFVPASASVADMMAKASEAKAHMAIIIDEHSGCAGVATLEDAIEEFFGEIGDEHDRGAIANVERITKYQWMASGLCTLEELHQAMGREIIPRQSEFTTLSGLLMWLSGRVPREGDVIHLDRWSFRVVEATRTYPKRVEITRERRRSESPPLGGAGS